MFEREKLFVFVSVFVYFVEGHTLKMEAFNKVESTIFRCAVSTSFYCLCPSLLVRMRSWLLMRLLILLWVSLSLSDVSLVLCA